GHRELLVRGRLDDRIALVVLPRPPLRVGDVVVEQRDGELGHDEAPLADRERAADRGLGLERQGLGVDRNLADLDLDLLAVRERRSDLAEDEGLFPLPTPVRVVAEGLERLVQTLQALLLRLEGLLGLGYLVAQGVDLRQRRGQEIFAFLLRLWAL